MLVLKNFFEIYEHKYMKRKKLKERKLKAKVNVSPGKEDGNEANHSKGLLWNLPLDEHFIHPDRAKGGGGASIFHSHMSHFPVFTELHG